MIFTRNLRNIHVLCRILNGNIKNPILSPNCKPGQFCTRVTRGSTTAYTKLSTFGRVHVIDDEQTTIHYKVTCVDPQRHPHQDVIFVTSDPNLMQTELKGNVLSVRPSVRPSVHSNSSDGLDCLIEVPIKFDVDVRLRGLSSVAVSNMESHNVHVSVERGDCQLYNVQTGEFELRSGSGDVISDKLLQGNGSISTDDGDIRLHKLQACNVTITSGTGDISVTNLYATHSQLRTQSGKIHLVNTHWNTNVNTATGGVTVGSVDGDLSVESEEGDMDVTLSQHHNVHLNSRKGDITISVPQTTRTRLDVQGDDVQVEGHPGVHEQLSHTDGRAHLRVSLGGADSLRGSMEKVHTEPNVQTPRTGSRSGAEPPQDPDTDAVRNQPHDPVITANAGGTVKLTSSESSWVAMIQRKFADK